MVSLGVKTPKPFYQTDDIVSMMITDLEKKITERMSYH